MRKAGAVMVRLVARIGAAIARLDAQRTHVVYLSVDQRIASAPVGRVKTSTGSRHEYAADACGNIF